MRLKQSRICGYAIISVAYIVAIIGGILLFNALNFSLWLNLLIADVASTVIVFVFSVIFSNASIYDPYWSVQPIVILLALITAYGITGLGLIMFIVVLIWGVRLTVNWAYTFHGLKHQDWRYTMLKEKTGKFYPIINFLGIHLFPTIVVYACILPVVYAIYLGLEINVLSIVFCTISLLAVVLQGMADVQMHSFRKKPNATFIRNGLWKYSRHPNYLGEILMWWGMAMAFVCAMTSMWAICLGAIINNLMFLIVSIPMADKKQSKKCGFNDYKSQTRMLLPIKK